MAIKKGRKLEKAAASCRKLSDIWKTCEVIDVISPGSSSPLKKSCESPKKVSPSKLRYEVCEKDSEIQIVHVVSPDNISRSKGCLSKDKTKWFLKHSVESKDGILKVKNAISEKYKLNVSTPGLSPGKKAKPEKSPKKGTPIKNGDLGKKLTLKKISSAKTALKNCQSPSKIKKTLKSFESDIRKIFPTKNVKDNGPVVLIEKDLKLQVAQNEKLELKEKRRLKKLEEKKMLDDYMADWKKKRDDLECEDLMVCPGTNIPSVSGEDLPAPTPINCGIPRDLFGEAISVMEFVHQFGTLLNVKSSFSLGLSLDLMERALTETDIHGPFNDMLQMFLLTVFKQQEQEEEEPDTSSSNDLIVCDTDEITASAIKAANVASSWPVLYHGCRLRQFPLDPFTLSELLRLHLLSSGADISTVASERGGFKNKEDPGLEFKIKNETLLKTLATTSVFLLSPEQRLQLLRVLMEQLLTYPAFRDCLLFHWNNLKAARVQLSKFYISRRRIHKKFLELGTEGVGGGDDDDAEKDSQLKLNNKEIIKALTEEEKAELIEFEHKEKELKATISKLQQMFRIEPLGTDRAHRSFWVFNTVEGLFAEDINPYEGQCMPKPTPTQLVIKGGLFPQDEVPLSFMRKFLMGINKSSDKENKLSKSNPNSNVSPKKLLSTVNTRLESPTKSSIKKTTVFGLCTSNPGTCPVHSANSPNRISWGFFSKESDLDTLISNLNKRGNRESVLKKNLIQGGSTLKDWMRKCPTTKLNILESIDEESAMEQRKSSRLNSKSNFAGMHPEEALEITLRDSILDNEDKIWSGGLGAIKVKDREAWRTAINNNEYDPQCDNPPVWDNLKLQPPLLLTEGASTSCTPTPPPSNLKSNVENLASAIIQVATCVQSRFIGAPLAESDEYRRKMERALAEIEKRKQKEELEGGEALLDSQNWRAVKLPKSPLDRWIESIQGCSSLSQLYLHLITLETSITWNRSALKACCRVCRKKGDGENMLLCDKCDRGFHMYCLKPPLKEIPNCEWFCPSCIPPPPKAEKKQKRRILNYREVDSESEQNSDEEDEEEEEEEEEEDEEDQPNRKMRRRENNSEDREENHNRCTSCHRGGHLICCDGCPESLHLACAQPKLRRVPRGSWYCHKCLKKDKKSSMSQNSQSESTSSVSKSSGKRKSDSGTGRNTSNSRQASSDLLLNVIACEEVISALSKHSECWPFLKEGNKKKGNNYSRIVKRPIDIATIRSKLSNMGYCSNNQFVSDVYLMFQNCEVYNPVKSDELKASKSLTRYFQTLLRRFKLEDVFLNGELSEKRPRRAV